MSNNKFFKVGEEKILDKKDEAILSIKNSFASLDKTKEEVVSPIFEKKQEVLSDTVIFNRNEDFNELKEEGGESLGRQRILTKPSVMPNLNFEKEDNDIKTSYVNYDINENSLGTTGVSFVVVFAALIALVTIVAVVTVNVLKIINR